MKNLIQFIIKHNSLLLFIILEFFSFYLILEFNTRQREIFLNSSNAFSNYIKTIGGNINAYINLKNENNILTHQNTHLLNYISSQNKWASSTEPFSYDTKSFNFINGIVINNSTMWQKNIISINRGTSDGVVPNSAVIGPEGVIGIILKCSSHFSTVISIINTSLNIGVAIKKNNFTGTTQWDGINYRYTELIDIPTHVEIALGDTIITNGYSSIFPYGIPVGTISSFEKISNSNFYKIRVNLFSDFRSLRHVYVINNIYKKEINELQKESTLENE